MINHYLASANITWIITLGLITFMLFMKRGNRLVNRFCLYTINISAWSFAYSRMVLSTDVMQGLFWARALHVGAALIPTSFSHFAYSFVSDEIVVRIRRFIRFGYALSVFFIAASFTPFFVPYTANVSGIKFYPQPGPLYLPFLLFFAVYVCVALWALAKGYGSAYGQKKTQIKYVFFAYFIGYAGGAQAFVPVYGWRMFPLSLYAVPVCMGILAYTVMAHRLLDINVIIRKTLIYSTVVGALMALYLAMITVTARLFEGLTGYQTIFSSAAAAAIISFCFQPLRKKVQSFVDAKFFRQYVDREEKLYELSREVITHTTPEAMGGALLQVINQTLYPKVGALFLRSPDGNGFTKVSVVGTGSLPEHMAEDNELARYFKNHPQPFVQDIDSDVARSHSTRTKAEREDAA